MVLELLLMVFLGWSCRMGYWLGFGILRVCC